MQLEEAWKRLREAADLAARRGSLLFHLDLAAEAGGAALAACGHATERLAVLADDDGYRVFALDTSASAQLLATAHFDAAGNVVVAEDGTAMPPRVVTIAQARATITAAGFENCVAVVVPAHDPRGGIEGYALTVAQRAGAMRTAGHWLLSVSPDGRRIVDRQSLIVGTPEDEIAVRRRHETTLVSTEAVPNELHTYLSLKHDVPLIVETSASGARWRVDGERTRLA